MNSITELPNGVTLTAKQRQDVYNSLVQQGKKYAYQAFMEDYQHASPQEKKNMVQSIHEAVKTANAAPAFDKARHEQDVLSGFYGEPQQIEPRFQIKNDLTPVQGRWGSQEGMSGSMQVSAMFKQAQQVLKNKAKEKLRQSFQEIPATFIDVQRASQAILQKAGEILGMPKEAQAMKLGNINPDTGKPDDSYHFYKTITQEPGGVTKTVETPQDRVQDAARWQQMTGYTGNDATAKSPPKDLLSPKESGERVKKLQDFLQMAKVLKKPELVNGDAYYGPETTTAITKWQEQNVKNTPSSPSYTPGVWDKNTSDYGQFHWEHDKAEFKKDTSDPNQVVPLNPFSKDFKPYPLQPAYDNKKYGTEHAARYGPGVPSPATIAEINRTQDWYDPYLLKQILSSPDKANIVDPEGFVPSPGQNAGATSPPGSPFPKPIISGATGMITQAELDARNQNKLLQKAKTATLDPKLQAQIDAQTMGGGLFSGMNKTQYQGLLRKK